MSDITPTAEELEEVRKLRQQRQSESAARTRFLELTQKPAGEWTKEDQEFITNDPFVRNIFAEAGIRF